MDILTATGGGGVPICKLVLLFNVPTVAVISTNVFTALAVKVTVAVPAASVVAVVGDSDPAVALLSENVTPTPLIGPCASVTVAVTVVFPEEAMDVVGVETITEVGIRGGVPIVIGALPLIWLVPTITTALMVAVVLTFAALNCAVATPDALVTAVAGLKEPLEALTAENDTLIFGTTAEDESVTVAVTVADPLEGMLEADNIT